MSKLAYNNSDFHKGGIYKSIPDEILELIPDGFELVKESELDDSFHPGAFYWCFDYAKPPGYFRQIGNKNKGCYFIKNHPDLYIRPEAI